jgi:hypothetical protein
VGSLRAGLCPKCHWHFSCPRLKTIALVEGFKKTVNCCIRAKIIIILTLISKNGVIVFVETHKKKDTVKQQNKNIHVYQAKQYT